MKTHFFRQAALFAALAVYGGSPGTGRCEQPDLCSCGPDFCLNDPRYPPLLKSKKDDLRSAGFGEDLIALLDQDGACVNAIKNAPDTFSIKRMIDGVWDTRELDPEREGFGKADLLAGKTTAYYKFNTSRAQACCGQPKFDQRPDWDSQLQLNLKLAIVCRKSGSTVACTNAQ